MIDAYLLLYDDNDNLVAGESSDDAYPNAIEIHDFDLGSGERGTAAEDAVESATGIEERMTKLTDALKLLNAKKPLVDDERLKVSADALTNAGEITARIKKLREELKEEVDGRKKAAPEKKEPTTTTTDKKKGGKPAKPDRLKFSISKEADSASADLFQAFCRECVYAEPDDPKDKAVGKFHQAKVILRRMFDSGPEPFLTLSFARIELDDYQLKFDTGRMTLTEDVTFTFVDFIVEYDTQTDAGTHGAKRVVVADSVGGDAPAVRGSGKK